MERQDKMASSTIDPHIPFRKVSYMNKYIYNARLLHVSGHIHIVVLIALLLLAWLFLAQAPLQTAQTISFGSTDSLTVQGFYPAETSDTVTSVTGPGFRWTDKDGGSVRLKSQGLGTHIVQLSLSTMGHELETVPITITINNAPIYIDAPSNQLRSFSFLIPTDQMKFSENLLHIQSPIFYPDKPSSYHEIGVGVGAFSIHWECINEQPWLVPIQVLIITITTSLLYLILLRMNIHVWPRLLLIFLFIIILISMRHSDTRFFYRYQAMLMTGMLGFLFLVFIYIIGNYKTIGRLLCARQWMKLHWLAFVGYISITLVMLYPLVSQFTTHILGPPGDTYEHMWRLHWFSEALVERHTSPMFVASAAYPSGFELAHSDVSPVQMLMGLPITWLFGMIISYNFLIITSYILSGFFTYLLIHRIGATRSAAWVAGLLFAFCLRRHYHRGGHLNLMAMQWFVLTLYGWEGLLTRYRPWDAYVSGVGLALTAWSSWYYGPTFALFLLGYMPLRVGIMKLPSLVQHWRVFGFMGIIVVALVLPVTQPYLEVRQNGTSLDHPLIELKVHSPRLRDYLLSNPYHPLWGTWARQFHREDGSEHLVALGYTLILLTLAGIWVGYRTHRNVTIAFVVLIGINLVVGLGPYLYLPNNKISLPALFIYQHVPVLDGIRVWNRMVLYVVLSSSILSGLALSYLAHRLSRIVYVIAAVLIVIEYAAVSPLHIPGPRLVDIYLSRQPSNGAVIQFPQDARANGLGVFYSLFSGKPTNSWHGTFPPVIYQEEKHNLINFPEAASLQLLQRWQTEYIIVDIGAMNQQKPDWYNELAKQPLVQLVYQDERYSLYKLQTD